LAPPPGRVSGPTLREGACRQLGPGNRSDPRGRQWAMGVHSASRRRQPGRSSPDRTGATGGGAGALLAGAAPAGGAPDAPAVGCRIQAVWLHGFGAAGRRGRGVRASPPGRRPPGRRPLARCGTGSRSRLTRPPSPYAYGCRRGRPVLVVRPVGRSNELAALGARLAGRMCSSCDVYTMMNFQVILRLPFHTEHRAGVSE
jgi:hypothetical protein